LRIEFSKEKNEDYFVVIYTSVIIFWISIYLYLGGEDFDKRVMEHFIKLYKKKKGKVRRKSNRAVQSLRRKVEASASGPYGDWELL